MIEKFVFRSFDVRVVFGCNAIEAIRTELEYHKIERALLLCSESGRVVASRVQKLAPEHCIEVHCIERWGDANELLTRIVEQLDQVGADGIVVVGGGSPIGFAKAVSATKSVRYIAVVTTYSGSEMAPNWSIGVGTDRMAGNGPSALPLTAIYDPVLTLSLPANISAASGMNAMAHAVESLYGSDLNPVVETMACAAIRLLGKSLPKIVQKPDDTTARSEALYAAWLAAAFRAKTGVEHAIAQRVRQQFGLDHSHTHAVVLPYVVAFNALTAERAMGLIESALGVPNAGQGLYDLNLKLGLPTGLKDIGMRKSDISAAIELVAAAKFENPRPVSPDDLKTLIFQSYMGKPPRF